MSGNWSLGGRLSAFATIAARSVINRPMIVDWRKEKFGVERRHIGLKILRHRKERVGLETIICALFDNHIAFD